MEGASTQEKAQTLYWRNGYAVVVPNPPNRSKIEHAAAGLPSESRRLVHEDQNEQSNASSLTPDSLCGTTTSTLPGWITHAGQILRFAAYFTEEVADCPAEAWRVRKVQILHYLEDGTTQVIEPRKDAGSGMVSGVLVNRMLIPATTTEPQHHLAAADFSVGGSVNIHGRTLYIVDADAFTRSLMPAAQLPALPTPVSPYDEYKARLNKPSGLSRGDAESPTRFAEILMGRDPGTKKLQQFLEGNSKVLRFMAIWDAATTSTGGEAMISKIGGNTTAAARSYFKIHYYLEDDTVEILELKEGTAAKEMRSPRFLARALLPKQHHSRGLALGSTLAREDCVSPADLRIGGTLEVHGRVFLINDADDFTKKWCVEHLGWGSEELMPVDVSLPHPQHPVRQLPPYNGFGDPEDSAYNCKRLIPAPPKLQRRQLPADLLPADLLNANCAALRFSAKLVEGAKGRASLTSADRARRFVVSFFLSDGTLAVFEPPVQNSGIVSGKYLERCKAFKAGGDRISEKDLYVGAVLELPVGGRHFELIDADAWSVKTLQSLATMKK